jgi:natural product biosynthesis luciferase-like monooxygenase protein
VIRDPSCVERAGRRIGFGLLFFSSAERGDARASYDLLLAAARFADANGFDAVWTPERHFEPFGGPYPNPSVLGAALAVATERVRIRAGSVVLPLHHPVRVVEEWSVVDNLSRGRVELCCASGWHPADFVLAPEPDAFVRRRELMFERIEQVRALWAGEPVACRSADGSFVVCSPLPRPIQPSVPIWLASRGTRDTFERAGAIGADVLTAFVNQRPARLADHIAAYRAARTRRGIAGPGRVAVMVHAFLDADAARARAMVQAPLERYLRTFLKQREPVDAPLAGATASDLRDLLDVAVERAMTETALIGTVEHARSVVETLVEAGVDELACVVDFGLPNEVVLGALPLLARLLAATVGEEGRA